MKQEEELLEIIKKNLPEQSVFVIKGMIEKSEKLDSVLENKKLLENRINELISKNDKLCSENEKLTKENTDLKERDEIVSSIEEKQKITTAELKQKCAEEKAELAVNLVSRIFGNKVIMETVGKSISTGTDYGQNGTTSHYPTSEYNTKTEQVVTEP